MNPSPIRYARTQDGLTIAFWTLGQGSPIVDLGTPPFSHLQLEWELPQVRAWYEQIATAHQLVRFDGRGTGLSDRDIATYSLDGMVMDLEAVVDRLSLPPFTLIGSVNSSLAAITYAATHPGRAQRLVLWCPYARGSDFFDDTGTRALRAIVDQDWHMFTEAAARARFSWGGEDFSGRYAELIRAAVTPGVQGALMDALRNVDVTPHLGFIRAPTLVMQREMRGVEIARKIAGDIPDARLVLFPGGSAAPYLDDSDTIWAALSEFLDAPTESADGLSRREIEVLRLVAVGKSNDEIASELVISVRTVDRHIANIYSKTGMHSKAQAVSYAHRHGFV